MTSLGGTNAKAANMRIVLSGDRNPAPVSRYLNKDGNNSQIPENKTYRK